MVSPSPPHNFTLLRFDLYLWHLWQYQHIPATLALISCETQFCLRLHGTSSSWVTEVLKQLLQAFTKRACFFFFLSRACTTNNEAVKFPVPEEAHSFGRSLQSLRKGEPEYLFFLQFLGMLPYDWIQQFRHRTERKHQYSTVVVLPITFCCIFSEYDKSNNATSVRNFKHDLSLPTLNILYTII